MRVENRGRGEAPAGDRRQVVPEHPSFPSADTERPERRLGARESILLAVVLLLLLVVTHDLAATVPPLMDDWWMIHHAPGALLPFMLQKLGWAARPAGMVWMDAVNSVAHLETVPLIAAIYGLRVLTLAVVYVSLRRLFRFALPVALFVTVIIGLAPPAAEAWTLLCTTHVQLAMAFAGVASGLYYRLFEAGFVADWRHVLAAGATQLLGLMHYEQAAFALPALVAVLAGGGIIMHAVPWRRAAVVVTVSAGASVIWLLAVFASGFAGSRRFGTDAPVVELADLSGALERLLHGFVYQHLWRVIELLRGGGLPWDIGSAWGVAAIVAAVTLAVMAVMLLLAVPRPESGGGVSRRRTALQRRLVLTAAALVAAYLAVVPFSLGVPGIPNVSRMYYIPGLFVALALGLLVEVAVSRRRAVTAVVGAAFILWSATTLRRYLADFHLASQIVREVVAGVVAVPPATAAKGLLVIAPATTGTFQASVVAPWSLRGAMLALTGTTPAGPLFFAESCQSIMAGRGVLDELERDVEGEPWDTVVVYRAEGVQITAALAHACAKG